MAAETTEAAVSAQNRSFKDIFKFQDIPIDVILRAMAIGMIFKAAIPRYGDNLTLEDFIVQLETNIMERVGMELPGSDHCLTIEEAQAIYDCFDNPSIASVFFNC